MIKFALVTVGFLLFLFFSTVGLSWILYVCGFEAETATAISIVWFFLVAFAPYSRIRAGKREIEQ